MIFTRGWLSVPTVLIVCALTTPLQAETFSFRNDLPVPVVIQVATVQRGALKRDQLLLRTGESTPKLPLIGDKVITVCDGKTGRVLFRDALRMSRLPLRFSIAPDPRMVGRARMMPLMGNTAPPEAPPGGPATPPAERPKPKTGSSDR